MNKQYLRLPIDELIQYENNPRINDDAVDAVAKSIEQCGYIAPIITDERMVIMGGAYESQGYATAWYQGVRGTSCVWAYR